jgi:hypothetical protein
MDEIGIRIVRYEQLYPEVLNLFWASNGLFQGGIRFYFERGHLKRMGKALSSFPDKIPGECSYSIGSQHPDDKSSYLILRAYMADNQGHTALQVVMNNKDDVPDEGECRFSIMAEPWAIHRLGELLLKFSDSKYCALNWSLNSDNDMLEEWAPLPKGEPLSKWLKEQWEWIKKNPPGPGDYSP